MTRSIVVALAALALLPATASAGEVLTLGKGGNPDIVTDANGTSYVAWNESSLAGEGSSGTSAVHFCILAAHANGCSVITLQTPASLAAPRVLLDPQNNVLVVVRRAGAAAGTFETIYYKGSGSPLAFQAAVAVAQDGDASVVGNEALTDGTSLDTLQGSPGVGFAFQNAPLTGASTPPSARASALFQFDASKTGYGIDVVLAPNAANAPLAVWSNAADRNMSARLGPTGADGNDTSKWGALTSVGAGTSPRLSAGATGVFLVSTNPLAQTQYEVRSFANSAFSAPVVLGSAAASSATADGVVDAAGSLHVVFPSASGLQYRRSDGAPNINTLPNQHAVTINCGSPNAPLRLGAVATGTAFEQVSGFVVYGDPADGNVKAISTDAVNCTPAGGGLTPAPADTTPPTMGISRRIQLRKGIVKITVNCPQEETKCKGAVELQKAPKTGTTPTGKRLCKAKKFDLNGNTGTTVKLKLTKKALKDLKKKRSQRILVVVTAADALGNSGVNAHRGTLIYHA